MKPVEQTEYGIGKGNCFSACVASILELPIEDVPHFCDNHNPSWFHDLAKWLEERGYGVIHVDWDASDNLIINNAYTITCGLNASGVPHAVISRTAKEFRQREDPKAYSFGLQFEWDPNKSSPEEGLSKIDYLIIIFRGANA